MSTQAQEPQADLAEELYALLRSKAQRFLSRSSELDPTELVHQAWVRMARQDRYRALSRAEFLALCATIMRRIAVDESRRQLIERREPERVTLHAMPDDALDEPLDLLALNDALETLAGVDPRWARQVELRFFGGLRADEVAGLLGLSRRVAHNDWILARAWLKRHLA